MRNSPAITVLMPVFNGERFIGDAIGSILAQTEPDFEFLIIDDGSTDSTLHVVEAFADPRIRIERCDANEGIVARLNWGLDHARGRYVARMDADDIAHPRRLQRQLEFMRAYPTIAACGTWFTNFSSFGALQEMRLPRSHASIGARMLFENPIGHPTTMFDMLQLNRHNLRYSREALHAEDYDLWVRAHPVVTLANIPEFLYRYRLHSGSIGARHGRVQAEAADRVRGRALTMLGVEYDSSDFAVHRILSSASELADGISFAQVANWAAKIKKSAGWFGQTSRAVRHECDLRLRNLKRAIAARNRR